MFSMLSVIQDHLGHQLSVCLQVRLSDVGICEAPCDISWEKCLKNTIWFDLIRRAILPQEKFQLRVEEANKGSPGNDLGVGIPDSQALVTAVPTT